MVAAAFHSEKAYSSQGADCTAPHFTEELIGVQRCRHGFYYTESDLVTCAYFDRQAIKPAKETSNGSANVTVGISERFVLLL